MDRAAAEQVLRQFAIGAKITSLRAEHGLSLRDLSRHSGLSASYLSRIERDTDIPSLETLVRIADALHVPVCHFFGAPPPAKVVRVFRDQPPPWRGSMIHENALGPRQEGETLASASNRHCIYVVRGDLHVCAERHEYRLATQDSICCDAALLEWYQAGEAGCQLFIISLM